MKKAKIYSSAALKKQIMAEAKSLNIAEHWAEIIANKTVQHVDAWVKNRSIVTETDIDRIACSKLQELNPDLAYIHQNHGKIL